MNRASYSLGIIASIAAVVVFFFVLVIALFAAFAMFLTVKVFEGLTGLWRIGAHLSSGSFVVAVVFAAVIAAAILGFVGISRLMKYGRKGGILMIAAGSHMLAAAGAGFCIHG
jgi:hypothetical protein